MNDDDLDAALNAGRPHTSADDGFANSPDGDRALAAIHRATGGRARVRGFARRHRGPLTLATGGLGAAVAASLAIALSSPGPTGGTGPVVAQPSPPGTSGTPNHHSRGAVPSNMALVAYDNCDAMLSGLRKHTAARVGPYGLYNGYGYAYDMRDVVGAPSMAGGEKSVDGLAQPGVADQGTPDHSGTNVQEIGVGEPDIVQTDGDRVVSVSGGVLRVVDTANHKVTGTLDLSMYAGAESAQLLMTGDRVLVLLGGGRGYYGGPVIYDYAYPVPSGATGSTFLLVDISAEPKIVSTLHSNGGYLDARMVGDTARLVVQSSPKLRFPAPDGHVINSRTTARNRAVVRHAPLSAWLPTYTVTTANSSRAATVRCEDVSHPEHYTGESMLTVFTVDLTGNLDDPNPISLAADGMSVYASAESLYVASQHYRRQTVSTELHRFDISGTGKPAYLGSGEVPGTLLNSYSMSEYGGEMRVVTTEYPSVERGSVEGGIAKPVPDVGSGGAPDAGGGTAPDSGSGSGSGSGSDSGSPVVEPGTSVYVLDADTLKVDGHVGGLGRGEQVHAVRFLGPLGYVVTFRSVDPLFVIDLHDPAHPRMTGELTVTGYSDYLHPLPEGRLLGVGQDVSANVVTGLQVSLFDVTDPERPQRLDRVTRAHSPSETPIDPHAFLYWPAKKLAVIPINSWEASQSGAALVVRVGSDNLDVVGTIRNPAISTVNSYDTGIQRTLVIGDELWTMSSAGLQVSDLDALSREAWVSFE